MITAALDWSDEFAKAAITFGFVALLGGAASLLWGTARHRRELDLASLERFHVVYGKWFAVWKGWETAVDEYRSATDVPRDERVALLKRATEAEGEFEACLVRIATERHLSDEQIRRLGRFREGYQQLRESLEKPAKLPFRVQFDDTQRGAYVAFKALSVEFAALLRSRSMRLFRPKAWGRPSLAEAQRAFVQVTSWRVTKPGHEETWWSDAGNDDVQEGVVTTLQRLEL